MNLSELDMGTCVAIDWERRELTAALANGEVWTFPLGEVTVEPTSTIQGEGWRVMPMDAVKGAQVTHGLVVK